MLQISSKVNFNTNTFKKGNEEGKKEDISEKHDSLSSSSSFNDKRMKEKSKSYHFTNEAAKINDNIKEFHNFYKNSQQQMQLFNNNLSINNKIVSEKIKIKNFVFAANQKIELLLDNQANLIQGLVGKKEDSKQDKYLFDLRKKIDDLEWNMKIANTEKRNKDELIQFKKGNSFITSNLQINFLKKC